MMTLTRDIKEKTKNYICSIFSSIIITYSNKKYELIKNVVTSFTGHDVRNFSNFNYFVKWMHAPVDAAALGIFRLFYGLAMLIDIAEERGGSQLDLKFGEPKHCHFPLLNFIRPMGLPYMGIVYLIMWLGAIGITLGYKFRIACIMYIIPYWYIFLLDKPAWNNHSYLFGLCGILIATTNANKYLSIDYRKATIEQQIVPNWNYFLIKFQFFVLYFLAGVKKFSIEWLSGYSMTNLGYHWVFAPFRLFLSVEMIELLIIHWFAAVFDFTIAFFMIYEKTRLRVTPFMMSFHLMNSRLFTIGMFPWVCLAEVSLFFKVNWPRRAISKFKSIFAWKLRIFECITSSTNVNEKILTDDKPQQDISVDKKNSSTDDKSQQQVCIDSKNPLTDHNSQQRIVEVSNNPLTENKPQQGTFEDNKNQLTDEAPQQEVCSNDENSSSNQGVRRRKTKDNLRLQTNDDCSMVINSNECNFKLKLRTICILLYCAIQLFLPFSHFITKGYNNWTNGLYGYSWDMMVHSYDTILSTIKVVDNNSNKSHFLEPYAFTEYDRWTKYADMAVQYAKCIERNLLDEVSANKKNTPLSSNDISIYFDIWCSMNGRFQQRVFDPRVDLLKANWSPFKKTNWVLPVLNELNHLRPKLNDIANDVNTWSNYSDVLFVADFPQLTLDNFISPELNNVTLTVLDGSIEFKIDKHIEIINSGNTKIIKPGKIHHVTTIGNQISTYMYTFINKTMNNSNINFSELNNKPILPLWKELNDRIKNYITFIKHIGNSVLFLVYGVPLPLRIRERN